MTNRDKIVGILKKAIALIKSGSNGTEVVGTLESAIKEINIGIEAQSMRAHIDEFRSMFRHMDISIGPDNRVCFMVTSWEEIGQFYREFNLQFWIDLGFLSSHSRGQTFLSPIGERALKGFQVGDFKHNGFVSNALKENSLACQVLLEDLLKVKSTTAEESSCPHV